MIVRTYKIGEAAQLLNLKSYVLRFWETEFSQLSPLRTEKGQRLYSENDLELLQFIRHLLHERGLTIEGARKVLQSRSNGVDPDLAGDLPGETPVSSGGEIFIPPAPPGSRGEAQAEPGVAPSRLPAPAARSEAQKLALDYAVRELKDIESLLRNLNQPE